MGIPGAEHVPAGSMLFMGFTKFPSTTHRQNLMLPPRADRSFRLAELI